MPSHPGDNQRVGHLWKAVQQWQEDSIEKGHTIERMRDEYEIGAEFMATVRRLVPHAAWNQSPVELYVNSLDREAEQAREIEQLRAQLNANCLQRDALMLMLKESDAVIAGHWESHRRDGAVWDVQYQAQPVRDAILRHRARATPGGA